MNITGNGKRATCPVSRFSSLPALPAADGYRLFPRGCVDPIHLDEKVLATDILIRFGAVRREIPGAKLPRALVSVLLAEEVVPRVEVLVGGRFFRLVSQNVHNGVRRGVVVRRALERCAATGELVGVRHRCVFHVSQLALHEIAVVGAVLCAESATEIYAVP